MSLGGKEVLAWARQVRLLSMLMPHCWRCGSAPTVCSSKVISMFYYSSLAAAAAAAAAAALHWHRGPVATLRTILSRAWLKPGIGPSRACALRSIHLHCPARRHSNSHLELAKG
eukprot:scaffold78839_cov20-Tisochrysis_lutea.AAC.3